MMRTEPARVCPLRLEDRSLTSLSGSTLRILTSTNKPAPLTHLNSSPSKPSPASLLILSYPSLQALTILTCIVACCLQFRAYVLSPHSPGAVDDADFYNSLQSALMQLLTTYTGLVPTVRSKSVRGLVAIFWVALLSIASVVLNVLAMGVYFHDDAMAPLLGFFGNVVQAIVVLHLATHVDGAYVVSVVLDGV